jgi:hypothetical protein
VSEEVLRRLLNRGLPDEDAYAVQRVDIVLRRCREQVYGRDTITLLFARLWVALASLLAQFLYLSRGHPNGRVAAYFAAPPRG